MPQPPKYEEIIALAIKREQEAIDLYDDMAARTESRAGKALFEKLAKMERGHKAKLQKADHAFFAEKAVNPPQDLRIADYLVDVELKPDSSYQDTLLYAAKREKAAFELYSALADFYTEHPEINKMFQVLAQEEAYHKLLLEREYDDRAYSEG